MRYQIGADPTGVLRTDVKIGLPFVSGPQASKFIGGGAGWTSSGGIIQAPASVVTAISGGIIEECGLFGLWMAQPTGTNVHFMLAHDNISSLPFSAGETINITESFTL